MSNVLGCVKKGGSKKKGGGSNFFIFLMFCHSRGVRALARAQISYKTARVVGRPPSWSHRGREILFLENSCSFSTYRWTTVPSHLVIGLLDWLQRWTKVAISSEKREKFWNFSKSQINIFFKKNNSKSFKSVFLYVLDDSDDLRKKYFFDFSDEILRLWLTLEASPYIQSVYPFSCTISTYRWTTSPKDFVIALLVWLQW